MERINPRDVHPYVWADHLHRYKWGIPFYHGVVLDVACGTAYGSQFVLESKNVEKYFGVDLSFEALLFAKKEYLFPGVSVINANADNLPIQSKCFDTIICFETLEHLENPEKLVSQFSLLLRDGGHLIGSVPSRMQEGLIEEIYGNNPFHKTRFDLSTLQFLISKYFKNIVVFEQSLVIGSLVIPVKRDLERDGKIIEDPSLAGFPPGNLLFVASNEDLHNLFPRSSFSFALARSLFQTDREYNNNILSLQAQLDKLNKESQELRETLNAINESNSELEQALEQLRQEKEERINTITGEKADLERALEQLRQEKEERINTIKSEKADLEKELEQLRVEKEQLSSTLDEINHSRYWKMIRWLWRQPAYIKLRNIFFGSRASRNISSSITPSVTEIPLRSVNPQPEFEQKEKNYFHHPIHSPKFSTQEMEWLENAANKKPSAISLLHPEWHGIHASAEQMFEVLLEIPDNLEPDSAMHYADLLAEINCPRIVVSGFPVSYRYLILALRQKLPRSKIFAVYHGQYNQYREDYDRLSFSTMIDLAKAGKVDKLGFVKAGMAEVVGAATGVPTGFLTNWIDHIPEKPSDPLPDGIHLGVWLLWSGNWRKPPFSMLAASLLVPNSTVHGADSDDQMKEYIQLMNIRANFAGKPLPRNELFQAMEKMHVNLYVTFHECSPMLPLESLSVGVPCLLGPVSHYFEDEPYLHEKLVVPYPDRAEVIAEYVLKSIEERTEIIKAYQNYAPGYNRHARELLAKFLDMP